MLGHKLFSLPQAFNVAMQSLAAALAFRDEWVRKLHPQVWRCFVWVFSRLQERAFAKLITSYEVDTRGGLKAAHMAFLNIKQDLRGSISIALVGVLLGSTSFEPGQLDLEVWCMSRALEVIHDALQSADEAIRSDGIAILVHLLSAVGTSSTKKQQSVRQRENSIVSPSLFDGTVSGANQDRLPSVIESMGLVSVDMIRHLSEEEIARHWDELIACWVLAVNNHCLKDAVLPVNPTFFIFF